MTLALYLGALAMTLIICSFSQLNKLEGINLLTNYNRKLHINKKLFFFIAAFIPLWILIAFRDASVGTDTGITYYRIFQNALNGSFQIYADNAEPGYLLFVSMLTKFTSNYLACIFVTGTVGWLIYYCYILKNSENIIWSLLLFFLSYNYFHLYNGIRQMIACGIVLIAFKYIEERKIIWYLGLVALAASIHIMAVIYIPFYFLYHFKVTIKRAIIIVGGSTMAFSVIWPIVSSYITSPKLKYYLMTTKYYSNDITLSYIAIAFVMTAIALAVQLIRGVDDKKYNLNLWLQIASLIIALNGTFIPEHHRVFWLFSVNSMIFAPYITKHAKYEKYLIYILVTLVFLADFIRSYATGMDQVQEYLFWSGTVH